MQVWHEHMYNSLAQYTGTYMLPIVHPVYFFLEGCNLHHIQRYNHQVIAFQFDNGPLFFYKKEMTEGHKIKHVVQICRRSELTSANLKSFSLVSRVASCLE